jgi:hypothetical protein
VSKKPLSVWYVNTDLMIVEEGQAIQKDYDGYHVINYGYVVNNFIFKTEKDAKQSLIEHLERKITSYQEKLSRLKD